MVLNINFYKTSNSCVKKIEAASNYVNSPNM